MVELDSIIASHSAVNPLLSDASEVAIYQNGSAKIQTTLLHSTICDINLKEFPFDSHECNLSFVSQGLPNDIFEFEPGHSFSMKGNNNPQWLLSALALGTFEETEPVYNETFSFLNVRFTLTRLPDFYLRMIGVPIQQLNTLALMAFFIPLKSGERVSSCLSLVLGQTVFQIIIADILPRTSRADREPILINFVLLSFLNLVCITVASTLTVNLSFQPWRIRNRTARYVVFHILGAVTFMKSPKNSCKNKKIGTSVTEMSPEENSNIVSADTESPSSSTMMTDMEFLAACLDRLYFVFAVITFFSINVGAFDIVRNSIQLMVR
ncbi:neuronal acetylcholine receptor subunit beta-4-like [Diadema setosum]|uniref:neuronal acetylcholine receptor subunit beta-4-like n=1 Tax=Diadema setosum TaxID=31175 RepID=UPI003B3B03DF